MAERRRSTLRDKKNALQEKRGRKPRFGKPKANPDPSVRHEIIFENSDAVPVDPVIKERGQRQKWTLENVEWIRIDYKTQIGEGGYGIVFRGRIKFKGVAATRIAAIKKYKREPKQTREYIESIIARLDVSGVPHPKMVYFESKIGLEGGYQIMEPFVKLVKTGAPHRTVSKLEGRDLIGDLDLREESDMEIFREAVRHTVKLSRAGLHLQQAFGENMLGFKRQPLRVDVFTYFILKKGKPKVLVQDLDNLRLGENKTSAEINENWIRSTKVLVDTVADEPREIRVSLKSRENKEIAQRIIGEIAADEGFLG